MFQVGRGAIGNALFFLLASLGIFMFLVGRWQERYGTRAMITVGAIICVLGTIVIAYASCLIMLYSWAVLMGISSCFILIPALTTVQRWYPEKRGLVSGTVNLVFGLSAAIMSPMFGKMLISMGYFGMNITIAILALIIGLGAAYLARSPEVPSSVAGQMSGSETGTGTGTGTRNKKEAGKEGARNGAEINIDIETNVKTNVKTVTETALNRSGRLACGIFDCE